MPMDPFDSETSIGSIDAEHRSGCKTQIWLVGANFDGYLTTNSVWAPDATNDNPHDRTAELVSARRHQGNRCAPRGRR